MTFRLTYDPPHLTGQLPAAPVAFDFKGTDIFHR
jgi:hypothetical protein